MPSLRRSQIRHASLQNGLITGEDASGWLLLAATSRGAAERFAAEAGLTDPVIVDRYELTADPRGFRGACRSAGIRRVAVHSVNWEREVMPQLYAIAMASVRGPERWLIDERTRTFRRLSGARTALRAALAPLEVLAAAGAGLARAGRFLARPAPRLPRAVKASATGDGAPLLAIWGGDVDATVGGSVTHISGVLKGLRRAGLRVGLVTTAPPPEQIAAAVDEVAVAAPPPPGGRATPELAALAIDEGIVGAAGALARRMGAPGVVYQRHAPLRMAGVRLARDWDVPLVLEWNGSAVWSFANWSHSAKPLKGSTARLMAAIERRVAGAASLVIAVSEIAGEKALEAGAERERVLTVPNAVDVEEVDAAVAAAEDEPDGSSGAPVVGWIGSFGDWHGAEVLIRAMPRLPSDARVIMVGDGRTRGACERLAAELGVADRVTWHGKTPHDTSLRLLGACDVLASPHVELAGGEPFFGSPTKIFEYMALSKPIVASRLGQIADVLDHDRTALLVTPGDERELGDAISALLADPERGARMAAAARREIETAHTWDHRARAILAAVGR